MSATTYRRVAWAAVGLTFLVVVVGAWVRLTHAGLGCPDWPGCYGRISWPQAPHEIDAANAAFPERPVEVGKAWREMLHRYLAGGVLLAAYFLAAAAAWRRRRDPAQPLVLPFAIAVLVTVQALFGMWTVTWKLLPAVVTAHLIGGMATLALLCWLALGPGGRPGEPRRRRRWVWLGLILLIGQIVLGGWTSSNYAASVCPEFPACTAGVWWPPMDLAEAFRPWREIGVDYSGGVLDYPARVAIHLAHRVGALVLAVYLSLLAALLWRWGRRPAAVVLLGVLAIQLALGVANVVEQLPLSVATAHNGGAAALLLVLVVVVRRMTPSRARPASL